MRAQKPQTVLDKRACISEDLAERADGQADAVAARPG
jgi:hypothetical protein